MSVRKKETSVGSEDGTCIEKVSAVTVVALVVSLALLS